MENHHRTFEKHNSPKKASVRLDYRLSTYGSHTFSVAGLVCWNALSDNLKSFELSFESFRQQLNAFLFVCTDSDTALVFGDELYKFILIDFDWIHGLMLSRAVSWKIKWKVFRPILWAGLRIVVVLVFQFDDLPVVTYNLFIDIFRSSQATWLQIEDVGFRPCLRTIVGLGVRSVSHSIIRTFCYNNFIDTSPVSINVGPRLNGKDFDPLIW